MEYVPYRKLSKERENGIENLAGQAVIKLCIKRLKYCFDQ